MSDATVPRRRASLPRCIPDATTCTSSTRLRDRCFTEIAHAVTYLSVAFLQHFFLLMFGLDSVLPLPPSPLLCPFAHFHFILALPYLSLSLIIIRFPFCFSVSPALLESYIERLPSEDLVGGVQRQQTGRRGAPLPHVNVNSFHQGPHGRRNSKTSAHRVQELCGCGVAW